MPEIAGPDAALVNPESPDDIAAMMLRLEHDDGFRERQIRLGKERVKLFSWKNTAAKLLRLYEDIYKETVPQGGKD